jgi:hypothetical protein
MASEDSVENLLLRNPPVLTVAINGVGKFDEFDEALASPVMALIHKADSSREDLIVDYARGKAHVVPEERNNRVPEDSTIRDLQDQHALIPWFGKDRAGTELLRSHFQELSSVPVLIEKELRLDETAERSGRMTL